MNGREYLVQDGDIFHFKVGTPPPLQVLVYVWLSVGGCSSTLRRAAKRQRSRSTPSSTPTAAAASPNSAARLPACKHFKR
eukprot:2141189-Rhodomonas_salina.2